MSSRVFRFGRFNGIKGGFVVGLVVSTGRSPNARVCREVGASCRKGWYIVKVSDRRQARSCIG